MWKHYCNFSYMVFNFINFSPYTQISSGNIFRVFGVHKHSCLFCWLLQVTKRRDHSVYIRRIQGTVGRVINVIAVKKKNCNIRISFRCSTIKEIDDYFLESYSWKTTSVEFIHSKLYTNFAPCFSPIFAPTNFFRFSF